MPLKRRPIEVFNLSFLDVVSCGFGAIILLLVLSLVLEPATQQQIQSDMSGELAALEAERGDLNATSVALQKRLAEKQVALAKVRAGLARLEQQLEAAEQESEAVQAEAQDEVKAKLQTVLQQLSAEMKNLLSKEAPEPFKADSVIGGIPVDSEYVVFVIDTSGSMGTVWQMVVEKVRQVLEVCPKVRGMQILNDNGTFMFQAYGGRWLPDTPARRRAILQRLRAWHNKAFSNSNPVQGIERALRLPTPKDAPMSIYVFGDDYNGDLIETALKGVERMNGLRSRSKARVRIHAFGFPVQFMGGATKNGSRFAHLMRRLAEHNSGSFVGLTNVRR